MSVNISIQELSSTRLLNEAYEFICLKRLNHSPNNSIWDVRLKWEYLLPQLQDKLKNGHYQFSPLRSYVIDGKNLSSWDAIDAIVLKAMSLLLSPLFQSDSYSRCKHLKGGIHQAVKEVKATIHDYQYVFKSDIHGYYESIQHDILLAEFKKEIQCEGLIKLLEQYLQRLEIRDGIYYHFLQGIPKGCPLSPLMGALMLKPLDDALSQKGFYCRFMDDWVILVKTKSQLRRVIKITHRVLKQLKLNIHPDKTMIGRITKGFDFLGIHFGKIIQIAKQSIENHRLRISQRYAQGMSKNHIDLYIKRWEKWCQSLLICCYQSISSRPKDAISRIQLVDEHQEKHHEKNNLNLGTC